MAKVKSRPGDMYIPTTKARTNKNTLDYTDNYGLSAEPSLAQLKATYIDGQGAKNLLEKGR